MAAKLLPVLFAKLGDFGFEGFALGIVDCDHFAVRRDNEYAWKGDDGPFGAERAAMTVKVGAPGDLARIDRLERIFACLVGHDADDGESFGMKLRQVLKIGIHPFAGSAALKRELYDHALAFLIGE